MQVTFNYSGSSGSKGEFLFSKLTEDAKHVMDFFLLLKIRENTR